MTGNGEIDPDTLEQLERLARSHPRSGREAQAKASALRTLERLAWDGRRSELPPCPPGLYPPKDVGDMAWLLAVPPHRSCFSSKAAAGHSSSSQVRGYGSGVWESFEFGASLLPAAWGAGDVLQVAA